MKVFVTGATGFIGANLVRLLLEKGYTVKTLVRPNSNLNNLQGLDIETVTGDLHDENLEQKMQGCQVLFHVAALYSLWQTDRDLLYHTNVVGTRQVLAAARKANIERTVYTSSVAAIGVGTSGKIVDETYQSPVDLLISDYKKSKYWAEQEAQKAVNMGQDVVIVNPAAPIGPRDIKPTPTGEIILRFLSRKMPFYVNTGLNLIDVRDVALGHILALDKGKTGNRYILGNENISFRELLNELAVITKLSPPQHTIPLGIPLTVAWIDEYILSVFGKSPSIPLDAVRMSAQLMYYDATLARTELGLPQSPIKKALQDAVSWFIQNNYVS